ncbi:MAG: hypothetical protein J6A33_06015, partial [Alphaproteobacteria bacterium]|nr:hypothetical protein [Alphaproteobacteria bacterium]
MINTKYLLYISTCLLISGNVQASNFKLTYDSSDIFSHGSALHTQLHTPNELKPISLFNPNNAVKLAAVCFAGQENCGELNFNSMDLDNGAQCEDEGYTLSCDKGKVPDKNNRCPHNKSYFKCRDAIDECDDGYSSTECSSEQIIEHYYSNEAGKSCYLCRDKTCSEGGYADYITSCQKGTEISFANKTCYQDVTDKNCEDLGYLSSEPENNKCTPGTECGLSCYQNCYQPTCEDENLFSECPDNHTCTEVTSYGKTCYKDDGQPSCSDGGYKNDIPTNNVCTQVDYYGTKCFKDCYQPTCDNGGYLDAQPAGQTCTPITYYDRNCFQNDCKASELPLPVLYSDKTVSNSIISGKTPIGIVLDKTKNLAIALQMTDGSGAASWGPTNNDIPSLQNYTQDPSSDSVSGKTLTDNALQQTSLLKNTGSIFYKAYNYQTEGTNKGDWFIPSASELKKLVSNSTAITNTIKQITGKTYGNPQNVIFWASNEYDNGNAWIVSSTSTKTSQKYMEEQFWLFHTYQNTTPSLNILYSDMSVSDKIISGKTPIGIVFDDTYGLAIALEDSPSTLA